MVSSVEQIKERISIVEVVSSYVSLKKVGKYYKGLSPFTNEKTPSFFISPDREMFYCFSTNQGGDIFTFIEKMEGVDFKGALKILAERAGVALTEEPPQKRKERDRLHALLESACAFFEDALLKEEKAKKYLQERGISAQSITHFRLGFAPKEWEALRDSLKNAGYKDSELEAAGLIKKSERGEGYYDRFRGRVMFPIADTAGRVVAFSGRILEKGGEEAKYINSPETELYNKSRILFGYDKARQVIRKHNFAILVEGQIDLVLSHQAGFGNTVAVSGTALSEAHITLLKRHSDNIVIAFDSDAAGIASAGKSAKLALALGMEAKLVRLPKGKDPADIILEKKDLWKKKIKEAEHVVDFYLGLFDEYIKDPLEKRKKARSLIFPFLRAIPKAMDREHYIEKTAKALGVSKSAVETEVGSTTEAPEGAKTNVGAREPAIEKGKRKDEIGYFLLGLIKWQETLKNPVLLTSDARATVTKILGEERLAEVLKDEKRIEEASFKVELDAPPAELIQELFERLVKELHLMHLKEHLEKITKAQREAEAEGNEEKKEKLSIESEKIRAQLAELNT